MIPKLLHLIWIGPRPPPWSCIETWRTALVREYPQWEVRLWRDEDLAAMPMQNREAYERTTSWCGKADIARYEIVHRHGGVYVDADSVWLGRPLEPVLEEAAELGFFGALEGSPELVMCGFFGGAPGHPILAEAIATLPTRLAVCAGQPQWVLTGPALLGEAYLRVRRQAGRPVAALVPFERLVATSWRGLVAAELAALVARHRREGEAISLQLGYTTNELWRGAIELEGPEGPESAEGPESWRAPRAP